MQVGMVGLGRMGANLAQRLMAAGHRCVVFDTDPAAVRRLRRAGAVGAASLDALAARLETPRVVWIMVPHEAVGATVDALAGRLGPGDTVVDGGNSHWKDSAARAAALAERQIHFVDVGTSGGIHGLTRGYCLMIGGEAAPVARLEPIFAALAPGIGAAPPTAPPGRRPRRSRRSAPATPAAGLPAATAEQGYLHCGPPGAGHFVKMVHNGIEYGLMAAYAEGFNLLAQAGGGRTDAPADGERPSRHADQYGYDFDLAAVSELWRRGSVVSSWLLDLTAAALAADADLAGFTGRVADSGEGRWTVETAVECGVPVPVLSAALFERFSSRGRAGTAERILSAMRAQFGGHREAGR